MRECHVLKVNDTSEIPRDYCGCDLRQNEGAHEDLRFRHRLRLAHDTHLSSP